MKKLVIAVALACAVPAMAGGMHVHGQSSAAHHDVQSSAARPDSSARESSRASEKSRGNENAVNRMGSLNQGPGVPGARGVNPAAM